MILYALTSQGQNSQTMPFFWGYTCTCVQSSFAINFSALVTFSSSFSFFTKFSVWCNYLLYNRYERAFPGIGGEAFPGIRAGAFPGIGV